MRHFPFFPRHSHAPEPNETVICTYANETVLLVSNPESGIAGCYIQDRLNRMVYRLESQSVRNQSHCVTYFFAPHGCTIVTLNESPIARANQIKSIRLSFHKTVSTLTFTFFEFVANSKNYRIK